MSQGGPIHERWQALGPYLDEALDLTGERRAHWLTRLRADDAALAAEVEALLQEHRVVRSEGFLERERPTRPPAAASLAGRTAGAYTLRALIGQGGMGSVWLADRSDGRFEGVAAVKMLSGKFTGDEGQARFRREGSILGRLRHPHIAHLIDAGLMSPGQPYLVLEYVDGVRIDTYCDANRLTVEARIRLFLDVLDAVAHAHACLVVHRDLKPSNVLVTRHGQVKLLDFGIAKLLEAGARESAALTSEGEAVLTPEYAAPEQLTGGAVTTATDVYALGVLLYVLLTGQHPTGSGARSPAEALRAVVDTEPRRTSDVVVAASALTAAGLTANAAARGTTTRKLRALLEGDLDTIVAQALKKTPHERYASAAALGDDLRRYLAQKPIRARPDSLVYRSAKFVRRNRAAVALAVLAALALAAGMAGTVSQARRATAQAALAEAQRDVAIRELSRAEAINDLNRFVLSDAPRLGQRFTVHELLARAEGAVQRQQEVAADERAELLLAIGYQYQYMDEHTKAHELLSQAYDLAVRSSDGSLRAKAACRLATSLAQAGDGERAEQLLREAEGLLTAEPQLALHRVVCLELGSRVAQERGDGQAAVQRAEAAQRLLSGSRFRSPSNELNASMTLASAYTFAGRTREAIPFFEAAYGRLAALGREDTRTGSAIANNWANALLVQGQPLRAERLFRKVVEDDGAAEDGGSPTRLNNLARALRDLHRLPEAAEYAELAGRKARQMGQEVTIDQSLFVRAAVYRQMGNPREAEKMLAELEPRLKRLPAGHIAAAVMAGERAQLARLRGDDVAALAEADRAVAIAEASSQRARYLGRFLLMRSELSLHAGHAQRARADAEAVLRLEAEDALPDARSSGRGLAYLALGHALRAEGDLGAAREAAARAVPHLRESLGDEHPATRSAQDLKEALIR